MKDCILWTLLCNTSEATCVYFFRVRKGKIMKSYSCMWQVAIYSATSTTKKLPELLNVNLKSRFDIHGSVHRRLLSRNTNKMQLCNRIYYSSSGALKCICSLWFICPFGDRPLPRLSLSLDNGRSPHGHINQRLQIHFRAPDDEWCAARNMFSF
jgi:hypothetical protein